MKRNTDTGQAREQLFREHTAAAVSAQFLTSVPLFKSAHLQVPNNNRSEGH